MHRHVRLHRNLCFMATNHTHFKFLHFHLFFPDVAVYPLGVYAGHCHFMKDTVRCPELISELDRRGRGYKHSNISVLTTHPVSLDSFLKWENIEQSDISLANDPSKYGNILKRIFVRKISTPSPLTQYCSKLLETFLRFNIVLLWRSWLAVTRCLHVPILFWRGYATYNSPWIRAKLFTITARPPRCRGSKAACSRLLPSP